MVRGFYFEKCLATLIDSVHYFVPLFSSPELSSGVKVHPNQGVVLQHPDVVLHMHL